MTDRYALGLDIGTVSIGWSVVNLDKDRIEDLGVRIFEKPENPKNGNSLSEPRRTARGARRRLRRRRQRLNYLKDFFINHKILDKAGIEYALSPDHNHEFNPYELRDKGLENKLSPEELFVALYHIAKRRGYKSNRKSIEENDKADDSGKVLGAINDNKKVLIKYKTIGQALSQDVRFLDRKRNKADDYRNSFIRADFEREIKMILDQQKKFYPGLSDNNIQLLLKGDVKNGNKDGLFYQRPFMTEELIEKMRGKCSLEPDQKRAPKASYSFEMFRLAQDLSHLQYTVEGRVNVDSSMAIGPDKKTIKITSKFLTADEIAACIHKCKATQKVTYRAIRETLGHKNDPSFSFTYIRGKSPNNDDLLKDPFSKEKNTFAELKFYHSIRKSSEDQPVDWNRIQNDNNLFDTIGEILSCNKSDDAIRPKLEELGLSKTAIASLMKLSFSGFGHISIKAARKITPELLKGNGVTYDKAMEIAGYQFSAKLHGDKTQLPPLNEDEANQITNPVVKRAISQVIKVVNAVIRKHGLPYRIGVECAGELAKNFKDRHEIEKYQDNNAAENDKIIKQLKEEYGVLNPTGLQITKMKYYREQDGVCIYSGKQIVLGNLFSDQNYCEIDHIIPFSMCGNDSRSNKVLVLNSENQDKGNRIPYEAWGNNETRWREFESRVNSNPKIPYNKKRRLLTKARPNENWNVRALNDTRYISVFMGRYLKQHLDFSHPDDSIKQRITQPNGAITTALRRYWHIPSKDRSANSLHHSVDATIIALTDQKRIQHWQLFAKATEMRHRNQKGWLAASSDQAKEVYDITDKVTGEILDETKYEEIKEKFLPWKNFDKEVQLRESQPKPNDSLSTWRDQFRDLYKNQDSDFLNSIHPIFVSRMPKRNGTGQVSKETLRSPKTRDNDGKTRSVRMRLGNVHLKDLENSPTKDTDGELYNELLARLQDNNDDPKKAFAEPVYKSDKRMNKNGQPISPVSTIKVYSSNPDSSGFTINGGRAYVNNGSMVRLDVYKKVNSKGKINHFFVPAYAHQIKKGHPEIRPTTIFPGGQQADTSFDFVCSLFPNDYVRFKYGNGKIDEGYYVKYTISTGQVYILPQLAASKEMPKKSDSTSSSIRYISPRSSVEVQRLDINVLGDNYTWS